MSLEDEPTGELPGRPEGDQPTNPTPGAEADDAAGDRWLGPDRTTPRNATSRADKRHNQRRR